MCVYIRTCSELTVHLPDGSDDEDYLMANSVEKVSCYEINGNENVGDCGPKEKSGGIALFRL